MTSEVKPSPRLKVTPGKKETPALDKGRGGERAWQHSMNSTVGSDSPHVKVSSPKRSWPQRESLERPVADSFGAFRRSLQRYLDSGRGSAAQERTIRRLLLPTLQHIEASLSRHGILPTTRPTNGGEL